MTTTTTNGLVVPDLGEAANGPAAFLANSNSIDDAYGKKVANVAALPVTNLFSGRQVYVEDIDAIAWYDDKTAAWQGYWKSYTPTITGTATPTLAFEYLIEPNQNVRVRPKVTLTAAVTTTLTFSLPVPEHASYVIAVTAFAGVLWLRDTSVGSTSRIAANPLLFTAAVGATPGTVACSFPLTTGTSGLITSGSGVPWTGAAWASGDTIDGEFTFRRA